MSTGTLARSQLGSIVVEHGHSLPRWGDGAGWLRTWPWSVPHLAVPLAAGVALYLGNADLSTTIAGGLLTGVGVLGGLLFQVLAWVSGRIATIADSISEKQPSPAQMALLRRLDIARANIAYASLISIVLVVFLGVVALVDGAPRWAAASSTVLLLHLGVNLLLVLVRINSIGAHDRIDALTAKAQAESDEAA